MTDVPLHELEGDAKAIGPLGWVICDQGGALYRRADGRVWDSWDEAASRCYDYQAQGIRCVVEPVGGGHGERR